MEKEASTLEYRRAFHAELLHGLTAYLPHIRQHLGPSCQDLVETLQFRCHHEFLLSQIEQPLFGSGGSAHADPFSLDDVYVELSVMPHRDDDDRSIRFDDPASGFVRPAALLEKHIAGKAEAPLLITGGPGSGKSSLLRLEIAKMIARVGADNTAFVFLPLSRLRGIPDTRGGFPLSGRDVPGLLQNTTHLDLFGKLDSSGYDRLVILCDGLDEIAAQGSQQQMIHDVAGALWSLASAERMKPVIVIISGRPHAFAAIDPSLLEVARRFEMVGMAVPKHNGLQLYPAQRAEYEDTDHKIDYWFDRRFEFLTKYTAMKFGAPYPHRPHIISESKRHDIGELTWEPLLLYLVLRLGDAEAAKLNKYLPQGGFPDYDRVFDTSVRHLDRNDIYQRVIWSIRYPVHRRPGAMERPFSQGGIPERGDFEKVLGCLALAAWKKGGGRGATVKDFLRVAESLALRREADRVIQALTDKDTALDAPRLGLLSIFYFGITGLDSAGDVAYEFTHKSFSDFLVASTLFERALDLFKNPAPFSPDDPRLSVWIDLAGQGEQDIDILEFLQDEAGRLNLKATKYDSGPARQVGGQATELVKLFPPESLCLADIPDDRFAEALACLLERPTASARQAARALFAVWNKRRTTGLHKFAPLSPKGLDVRKFLAVVSPPATREELFSVNAYARGLDFIGQSLDSWDFRDQDFSDLTLAAFAFQRCDLLGAEFWATTLNEASFSQCRLDDVEFIGCLLEGVGFVEVGDFDIVNCKCHRALFTDCHFKDRTFAASDFSSSMMEGCVFEKVTFNRCIFEQAELNECHFIDCRFEMCDFVETEILGGRWIGCTEDACRFRGLVIKAPPTLENSRDFADAFSEAKVEG
ncbi:pentapeptide repeat-containing protein [Breoghania sp. L-A4]|uniref:pentapeptide repeat-containing protein n=1 Tax=Breoghania sp. L-A4 TaxID=2304600 RepID=UPI0013C2E3E3|nr:pentapeptide repeat-containing protein [Breoghania sp. L-A4]